MLPRHAVSDGDWGRVEPLLPTRGPAGDRRRFVDAVPYVARAGAPWRDPPGRFGRWNSGWRRSDRWPRPGVRQRVFDALPDPDLGGGTLDSTAIRAHPAAAGAGRKRTAPAAGASRPSGGAGAGSGPRPTSA